jgi:Putative zinc-finger
MDCDKVESAIMDELYGELDDVTSAAVKRHIAGCARCTVLLDGLRATRKVAVLQLVDPPPDLELRILRAAGVDRATAPVERPLARVVSAAGSWAMRPQTAMAAVFLVMLGASVLLLRGRSSRAPASSEMIVTEKGTPAPAPMPPPQGQPGEPAAPSVVAVSPANRTMGQRALNQAAIGTSVDLGSSPVRERTMAKVAPSPKPDESAVALRAEQPAGNFASPPVPLAAAAPAVRSAPRPAKPTDDYAAAGAEPAAGSSSSPGLAAARALRDSQGCRAAVSRFDEVAQHAAGSSAGWEALLESARCYRSLGDSANARARFTTLLGVAEFKDRARSELDLLDRPPASPPPP